MTNSRAVPTRKRGTAASKTSPFLHMLLICGIGRLKGTDSTRHGKDFPYRRHLSPFDTAALDRHHHKAASPLLPPYWHDHVIQECKSSSTNSWENDRMSDSTDRRRHNQHVQQQQSHFLPQDGSDDYFDGGNSADLSAAFALGERGGENAPSYDNVNNRKSRNPSDPDSIQTRRGTFSSRRSSSTGQRLTSGQQSTTYSNGGYHSPVVYQYFAARGSNVHHHHHNNRGSPLYPPHQQSSSCSELNFIILGPNVDHWSVVGPILASRGFNVIACERVEEDHDEQSIQGARRRDGGTTSTDHSEDAPNLVLQIMESLKWDRVVLVGCDEEAILAIETAMMLAPSGAIAGLVLCGDLSEANQQAQDTREGSIDAFLNQSLECPHVIIWDGGVQSSVVSGSSAHAAVERTNGDGRCVILGGGSVPHRTKPEQFSWILTRFVQEKIDQHHQGSAYGRGHPYRILTEDDMTTDDETDDPDMGIPPSYRPVNNGSILGNLNLPFGINSLVSPEGRLLLGRALAAAMFYISIAKVLVVQYNNLRYGVMSIRSGVDSVDALRRKLFHAVGAFVVNFGYIPRLFKLSFKRTREVDEDDIDDLNSEEEENDDVKQQQSSNLSGDDGGSTQDTGHETNKDNRDDEMTSSPTIPLDPEDDDNRPKFKPLFFLDNIIT